MALVIAHEYIASVRRDIGGSIVSAIAGDITFALWAYALALLAWPVFWDEIASEWKTSVNLDTGKHSWVSSLAMLSCWVSVWASAMVNGIVLVNNHHSHPFRFLACSAAFCLLYWFYKKAARWVLSY